MISEYRLKRYQNVFIQREFEHKTLEKVASRYGVTRERIRQLEVYARKYFKKYPHLCPNYGEITVKITPHLNGYSYFISRGFSQLEGAGGCTLPFIYERIKISVKKLNIGV